MFGNNGVGAPHHSCTRKERNIKAFAPKSGRPWRSREAPASSAAPVSFASKFNALSAIERRGTLRVRCVLQRLTRPRTFVSMALGLLLAPPLWFSSRTAAPLPPFDFDFELEERRSPHVRFQPRNVGGTVAVSPAKEFNPPVPDEAERFKNPTESPVPTTTPRSGTEGSRHRGRREGKESSWRPPVLPVEVFRDVPPEECVRNPLWEKKVHPSDYEFGCEEINEMLAGEKELIGHGNIRDVYMVEHEGRKLVLKALREDYELRASKARADKIHRWEAAALDEIKGHPNVVDMLGACGASSVSEFYDVRLDDLVLSPGATPLSISMVVSMALDAARGLQALHEAPGGAIVHFDIKPQQMMLGKDGRVKINDLNMCRFVDADANGNSCAFKSSACRVGPWRAPENMAGKNLTEKVDIYGLAMVYYSMLALHPPYSDVPDGTGNIKKGIPPTTDPSWHPGFLEIVRDMWNPTPMARPSARRVVQRLEILQQHLAMQTV